MKDKYCIILTTFESTEQANDCIDTIIEKKLAACVQIVPITSKYFWDNSVQQDEEVLVLFKTRDSLYDKLKAMLEDIHPYETPEILKVAVADGSEGYLKWIREVTIDE